MDSLDHCSSVLIGSANCRYCFWPMMFLVLVDKFFSLACINRDEEKRMGTLVKEDFGKPDRSTTMVLTYFQLC